MHHQLSRRRHGTRPRKVGRLIGHQRPCLRLAHVVYAQRAKAKAQAKVTLRVPPPITERMCVEILVGRGVVEVDK